MKTADKDNAIHRSKGELDLAQYFPNYLCWDELYLTFISLEPVADKITRYNLIEDTLKHLLIELAGIELGFVTPAWKGHRKGIVVELTDLIHSCDNYKGKDTAAVKLVDDFIASLTDLPERGWESPFFRLHRNQNQKEEKKVALDYSEMINYHNDPSPPTTLPQQE